MRVVITEKPSVARDLARVLGVHGKHNGYLEGVVDGMTTRISWCFGHMAELVDPAHYTPEWKAWRVDKLPMLPDEFEIRVRKGATDQFKVLKRLLLERQTTEVINACDAGREGELIFRWVVQLAGVDRPVRRLWVSSLTDEAIQGAWRGLRQGAEFDRLGDAARCRSEADWLVGMNATRAMTLLARKGGGRGPLLSVGRVQTPTLAMIVNRDLEIERFVPENFWQVQATFTHGNLSFVATWFRGSAETRDGKDGPATNTRMQTEEVAQAVADATERQVGVVARAERKRTTERPPLLYDLTSLQRRANQRYGFSADRTLELAQALYERHKVITYPRTDARFLTPDQVPELQGIVVAVGRLAPYAPHATAILDAGPIRPGKRMIDASEVGDHHAILPTTKTPDSGRLQPDEKRIYDLVARRLLAALSADAIFDVANLVVEVPPEPSVPLPETISAPLTYRASGRICVDPGWQAVDPPKKRKDVVLPQVQQGSQVDASKAKVKPGQTRPPRPHDDASLLKGMETAGRDLDDAALKRAMRQSGLGTPATRAAILTTLVSRQFVVRQKRTIRSTERGRALIAAVPVDELKSAELTGRWEARLAGIAEGKDDRASFMEAVKVRTGEVVAAVLAAEPPDVASEPDEREVLGKCPICDTDVREGRAAFSCETGRDCTFVIFKSIAKRAISKRSAVQLLKEGRTPVLKRFKSKKGKPFEASLTLDEAGRVKMVFAEQYERPPQESRHTPKSAEADFAGKPCPKCGEGTVIRGKVAFGCSRWREGCDWRT